MASRSQIAARAALDGEDLEELLRILDKKVQQLKLDYEQYFLGTRPREPSQPRQEVQKQVNILQQTPMQNTALRFRFNSICSRFMSYRRQWEQTLRQMEAGTYQRHVFKARIHSRPPVDAAEAPAPAGRPEAGSRASERIYSAYMDAARRCGQDTSGLDRAKLAAAVKKQEAAIRQRYGCEKVKFRVVVEGGKVKLKASPVV